MPQARSRIDFQVGDDNVKTLHKVEGMEIYLAAYTDGTGKKEQRLVCRPKGTKKFYFLFAGNVEANMRSAAPWLQEQLEGQIGTTDAPIEVDNVPVPVGDPMGD
jgi:hypothetical protein